MSLFSVVRGCFKTSVDERGSDITSSRRGTTRRALAALGSLIMVHCLPGSGDAASAGGIQVDAELELLQNTLDGFGALGCKLRAEAATGRGAERWFTFGEVRQRAGGGWEAASSSSRCGIGLFDKVKTDFTRMVGTPYVITEVSSIPDGTSEGGVILKTRLKTQKLTGFDKDGWPVYALSTQERALDIQSTSDAVLPLLIPDSHEKEAFAVHEVLLRLRAAIAGPTNVASYGAISVTADMPGAKILLDEGLVGSTLDGGPFIVKHVLAGRRVVCARDLSGREECKHVLIEEGSTTDVSFKLLDPAPQGTQGPLAILGTNLHGRREYWRVKDGSLVVRIDAGEFLMGSPQGEGEPHEHPQHRVRVSEFLIDKTEVTWRQYRRFAAGTGRPLPPAPIWGTPDEYPVSNVHWEEAGAYCAWAGARLPTEAEWEMAARGTDGRRYAWGDEWDPHRCNSWEGGPNRPMGAGSYPDCASPYGVLDMAGSMWEWCADWYGAGYYAESPDRDPKGPTSGQLRVIRGGGWVTQPTWLRPAYRHKIPPSARNVNHGFRCAQAPP